MNRRTIRQPPLRGSNDPVLVHLVRATSSRGYIGYYGTDYDTYCGLRLTSGEQWAEPRYDFVNCVRCLGTPKSCVVCHVPLSTPRLPSDVPERCGDCTD